MDALLTSGPRRPAAGRALPSLGSVHAGTASIILLLALQCTLIFSRAINWDEFFFYGQVAQFARGELETPLQTLHVHGFRWLVDLPGSAIDHILTARLAMFVCECVTIVCIYALARRFADRLTSVLAALSYISAGYVLQHGMSFRVDPPVTATLMVALALFARASLGWWSAALIGALVAVAGMITIKAVLFAPAFAGLAWMRWADTGRTRASALRIAAIAVAALAVFLALYVWHSGQIAGPVHPDPALVSAHADAGADAGADARGTQARAAAVLNRSASDMFFVGLPPYWPMIVKAASLAPLLAVLILAGPFTIARSALPAHEKYALAGLWLPVLTLAFYRNTAGYYYVFLLPPLAVAVTCGLRGTIARFGAVPVMAVMLAIALATWVTDDRQVLPRQRAVSNAVQTMFPQGTAYFDHSGMIAAFRKVNGFMTPWGMEQYRRAGSSSYRAAMERQAVPLLIENDTMVTAALKGDHAAVLLPEDSRAWRGNYVNYWGTVWLAGKTVPAGTREAAEFLVPGPYRAEGAGLVLDGAALAQGETVDVGRGMHVLANRGSRPARLVWAAIAQAPQEPPPTGDLWIGY